MSDPRSTPPSGSRFGAALALSAILVPLALGLLLSWHSLSDVDVWLHDRVGRQILAGEGTPANADLTFSSPDHPWMNHETAFQLLIAPLGPAADDRNIAGGGWNALRVFLAGVLLSLLLLGDGRMRRLREASGAAAWIGLPLLAGLFLLWPRLILRPELVSYALFVVIVRRVESVAGNPSADTPWFGILDPRRAGGSVFWLTVLWAWFHGFAALAPALWLLGGLAAVIERRIRAFGPGNGRPPRATHWLAGLGLTVLALALTPNGLQGLVHPVRILGQFSAGSVDMKRVISELAPLLETKNSLHLTLLGFRLSLVWVVLFVVGTWGRVGLLRVLLVALAAWGAFLGQRNLGFYAVAFCLLHTGVGPARGLSPFERLTARWSGAARLTRPLAVAGAVLTLLAGGLWAADLIGDSFYLREGVGRRFGGGLTPAQYPLAGADRARKAGWQRMFANLGGAAVLLDRAETRLFLDGRTEAHPPEAWRRYGEIRRGGDRALGELDAMRAEAVLIGGGGNAFGGLTSSLLVSPRWRLALAEEAGLLFAPAEAGYAAARDTIALRREADRLEQELLGVEKNLPAPRFADRCLAVSRLWGRAGQPVRQERILRRGIARRPDHPVLQHNLGNLLMARERWSDARAAFEAALATNPRLAGSALNRGVCWMSEQRFEEAAAAFAQAVRIDPELFEGWVNLGTALERTGKPAEALRALRRALELRPADQRLRRYVESRSG